MKTFLQLVAAAVLGAAIALTAQSVASKPTEDLMTVHECFDEAQDLGIQDGRYVWKPTDKSYNRKGICELEYQGQKMTAAQARKQWADENLQGFAD